MSLLTIRGLTYPFLNSYEKEEEILEFNTVKLLKFFGNNNVYASILIDSVRSEEKMIGCGMSIFILVINLIIATQIVLSGILCENAMKYSINERNKRKIKEILMMKEREIEKIINYIAIPIKELCPFPSASDSEILYSLCEKVNENEDNEIIDLLYNSFLLQNGLKNNRYKKIEEINEEIINVNEKCEIIQGVVIEIPSTICTSIRTIFKDYKCKFINGIVLFSGSLLQESGVGFKNLGKFEKHNNLSIEELNEINSNTKNKEYSEKVLKSLKNKNIDCILVEHLVEDTLFELLLNNNIICINHVNQMKLRELSVLFNIPIISTLSNLDSIKKYNSFNRMKLMLKNVNSIDKRHEFSELKGLSMKREENSYLFVSKEEEEVNSDYPLTIVLKGRNDIEIEMKKEEFHKEYNRLKRIIERKNYIRGSGIIQLILYFHFLFLSESNKTELFLDDIINKILCNSYLDLLILLLKNHDIIIENIYDIIDEYVKLYYQSYKKLILNNQHIKLNDFVMKLPTLIENELVDDLDSVKCSFVSSIHVLMNIISIGDRISRIK